MKQRDFVVEELQSLVSKLTRMQDASPEPPVLNTRIVQSLERELEERNHDVDTLLKELTMLTQSCEAFGQLTEQYTCLIQRSEVNIEATLRVLEDCGLGLISLSRNSPQSAQTSDTEVKRNSRARDVFKRERCANSLGNGNELSGQEWADDIVLGTSERHSSPGTRKIVLAETMPSSGSKGQLEGRQLPRKDQLLAREAKDTATWHDEARRSPCRSPHFVFFRSRESYYASPSKSAHSTVHSVAVSPALNMPHGAPGGLLWGSDSGSLFRSRGTSLRLVQHPADRAHGPCVCTGSRESSISPSLRVHADRSGGRRSSSPYSAGPCGGRHTSSPPAAGSPLGGPHRAEHAPQAVPPPAVPPAAPQGYAPVLVFRAGAPEGAPAPATKALVPWIGVATSDSSCGGGSDWSFVDSPRSLPCSPAPPTKALVPSYMDSSLPLAFGPGGSGGGGGCVGCCGGGGGGGGPYHGGGGFEATMYAAEGGCPPPEVISAIMLAQEKIAEVRSLMDMYEAVEGLDRGRTLPAPAQRFALW